MSISNITLAEERYNQTGNTKQQVVVDQTEKKIASSTVKILHESEQNVIDPISTFQRIVRWVGRTWLVKAIKRLFQRIFNPTKYKENSARQAEKCSDNVVHQTADRVKKSYLNGDVGVIGKDGETFRVKNENITGSKKIKHSDPFSISKATYEKDREVPKIKSGSIELTPIRVINETIEYGKIVPTSIKYVENVNETDLNHLTNIYTCKIGSNPAIIRSGVVDTHIKVKELFQVVKSLANSNTSIRFVSHQLNSQEREKAFIENQHRELLTLKDQTFEIAHINTPTNRFFEYTIKAKSVPVLGQAVETVLSGEKLSKQQNIEGWSQYFLWLQEDFKIESKNLIEIKQQLSETLQQLDNKKALKRLRTALKKNLVKIYNELKESKEIEILLFRNLIGQQLDIPGHTVIDRGSEIMMIQLLNDLLKIISGINCKSGIDRTTFVHAVKLAFQSLNLSKQQLFDFVSSWDKVTLQMNQKVTKENWKGFTECLEKKPEWRLVNDFRQLVLKNLLNHGLPITFFSTGLMGMRWNEGAAENRHPLNFIPPYIEVDTEATGQPSTLVQIVKYDASGKPLGITNEGRHLLTQNSPYREA